MKKVFKTEQGQLVDAISHTIEVLAKQRDTKIFIGTDSQNKRHYTCFVVAIAYRFDHKGAHFIYHKENVPKIKDRNNRLLKEVALSVEVAEHLEKHSIKIEAVEIDFNGKKSNKKNSNMLVSTAKSWVVGSGFKCTVKFDNGEDDNGNENMHSAVRAADHICRR